MGAAYFYHLTQRPLEPVLGELLERALGRGWRVAVRGRDGAWMDRLDAALWLGKDEAFLPHGRAGGPHDALQPVLLVTAEEAANAPSCLMAVDGADVSAREVAGMERVCVLFDGHDEAALGRAREQWRSLTAAGCSAQYWSEAAGRWEMKAES